MLKWLWIIFGYSLGYYISAFPITSRIPRLHCSPQNHVLPSAGSHNRDNLKISPVISDWVCCNLSPIDYKINIFGGLQFPSSTFLKTTTAKKYIYINTTERKKKEVPSRDFLGGRWLRPHTFTTEGGAPIPGQESKNLCAAWSRKRSWSVSLSSLLTCWLIIYLSFLDFFFLQGNYKLILCDCFTWEICEFQAQLFYHSACSHFLLHLEKKTVSNLINIWALFSFCVFELKLSVLMVQTLLWMCKLTQRLLQWFLSSCLRTQPALERLDDNSPLSLCRNLTTS